MGYNSGYTLCMKTAISIPDEIFKEAEALAHQMGISRSELYVTAIALFLESKSEIAITESLNEVYQDLPQSAVDPLLAKLQLADLSEEKWE